MINSWTEAFHQLKTLIDGHNHKITEAQAKGVKLPSCQKKIKSNERATAEQMLRIYLEQLHSQHCKAALDAHQLPGLHTYTPSLAKLRDCSEKTIQNHRKTLMRNGILSSEENKGGNGLYIWFNPQVILKSSVDKPSAPTHQNENSTIDRPEASLKTKNLHPLLQDLQDQENEIIDGDKWKNASSQKSDKSIEAFNQDLGKTKEKEVTKQPYQKRSIGGIETGATKKRPLATNKLPQEDSWNELGLFLAKDLWIYAKHKIYPHEVFAEHDERVIVGLIWRNILYTTPQRHSQQELEAYQTACKKRIDWASSWIARKSDYIAPPPHFYFGSENRKGTFHQTLDWHRKSQQQKVWKKIMLDAQKLRKGKLQFTSNGNKYLPTVQQVYESQLEYLMNIGDQVLINRFNTVVATNPSFYLTEASSYYPSHKVSNPHAHKQ